MYAPRHRQGEFADRVQIRALLRTPVDGASDGGMDRIDG